MILALLQMTRKRFRLLTEMEKITRIVNYVPLSANAFATIGFDFAI
jgi:hypothetical protein